MEINKNKLMIVGPSEIEDEILNLGSQKMMYNRTNEFSRFMKNINENLKYLFQTENPVYTFVSSGTGAMEAAVSNTFRKKDKVLVLARGQWGLRWAEIAKSYGLNAQIVKLGWDERIEKERLNTILEDDVAGVLTNSNETTLGLTTDIAKIGSIIKDTGAIFVVDAISSIGADTFKTDEWYCDIVIASTQKGLALPPGMSFLSVSTKAKKRMQNSDLPKYYYSLNNFKEIYEQGQTPFTPAVGLLYQLDLRLKKIREKGIDKVVEKHLYRSEILRAGISTMNIEFVGTRMSNAVTGLLAPNGLNAREIIENLRNRYNIELAPSPGDLEKKVFRVGLFGDIKIDDIIYFLNSLEGVLIDMGHEIKKGSAVAEARKKIKD